MGLRNSSLTRVTPVFHELLTRDPSGYAWMDTLISLGSRAAVVATIPRNQRLVPGHPHRWGNSEFPLPPPLSLLKYLVQNLDRELVAASGGSDNVRGRRMALAVKDEATIREALRRLGSKERGRKWFVLEGVSKPDALLETEDLVLCVEGKRTERKCTTHTSWLRNRSQLIRHMDAATELFPHKRVLGLLIVEGGKGNEAASPHWVQQCEEQYSAEMLISSLPHRTPAERQAIADNVLGVTTWQAVCAATQIPWSSIPDLVSG